MSDDVRDRAREIGDNLIAEFRERIAQQREEIERLEDERRRLLAFRDAFDRMVFSIGSGADERYRYDVVRAARAAVADIESEGE